MSLHQSTKNGKCVMRHIIQTAASCDTFVTPPSGQAFEPPPHNNQNNNTRLDLVAASWCHQTYVSYYAMLQKLCHRQPPRSSFRASAAIVATPFVFGSFIMGLLAIYFQQRASVTRLRQRSRRTM
eukprot:3647254-Pyramimonas_sp.AAC.1